MSAIEWLKNEGPSEEQQNNGIQLGDKVMLLNLKWMMPPMY